MGDSAYHIPDNKCKNLSKRELEVLSHVVDGESSKIISKALKISFHTVESHRKNIHRKLGVHNIAELTKIYWANR